jgi:hypothetical protein
VSRPFPLGDEPLVVGRASACGEAVGGASTRFDGASEFSLVVGAQQLTNGSLSHGDIMKHLSE